MTRHLLPLLAILLVFVVAVATPHPAMAGGYDVIACNQTVAGGANFAIPETESATELSWAFFKTYAW